MAADLKIHRGRTIDHVEVAVHGGNPPLNIHTYILTLTVYMNSFLSPSCIQKPRMLITPEIFGE
jgi:hypothetical protein